MKSPTAIWLATGHDTMPAGSRKRLGLLKSYWQLKRIGLELGREAFLKLDDQARFTLTMKTHFSPERLERICNREHPFMRFIAPAAKADGAIDWDKYTGRTR